VIGDLVLTTKVVGEDVATTYEFDHTGNIIAYDTQLKAENNCQ